MPYSEDPRTDGVLVKDARQGDSDAFAVLLARYARRALARVSRIVPDREDARDVTQDVLLKAFTQLAELREPERFGAWVGRIADNGARGWHRRHSRQLRLAQSAAVEPHEPSPSFESDAAVRAMRARVREALAVLSPVQREVVIHHYVKGYSYQQTAALLGVEVRTVRSRLQKARRRLHGEMTDMTATPTDTTTYELTPSDFEALSHAQRFLNADDPRSSVRALCLDVGGRVVATDGHRLFVAQLDGTSELVLPVLLAEGATLRFPEIPGGGTKGDTTAAGTLTLSPDGAHFAVAGEAARHASVLDEPYPAYESAIPQTQAVCVRVAATALRAAVHEIADHLADRHPLDAAAGETYLPAVALRVSASEGNLELVTTRDLGYASDASEDDSGQPSPRAGAPDWRFSIRVEAEVNVADDLDPFGIGVDHRYLSDALEVLAGPIELRMTTPREPLCLVTLEGSARQVVIMPLAPPSA